MATHNTHPRLALRPTHDRRLPDGAWWPESRSLTDELAAFVAAWPVEAGRIARVVYSPPDWDDHPHSVVVPGRRIKTGSFPHDDTHLLIVSLQDGTHRRITVIPPETAAVEAEKALAGVH